MFIKRIGLLFLIAGALTWIWFGFVKYTLEGSRVNKIQEPSDSALYFMLAVVGVVIAIVGLGFLHKAEMREKKEKEGAKRLLR